MAPHRTALPLSQFTGAGAEDRNIERFLGSIPGVLEVFVNPVTEMAYVEYDAALTGPDALWGALRRAGYGPADREAVRRQAAGRRHWAW